MATLHQLHNHQLRPIEEKVDRLTAQRDQALRLVDVLIEKGNAAAEQIEELTSDLDEARARNLELERELDEVEARCEAARGRVL